MRGAEPLGSAPLDASVRTAGSLVAAEVGHGLVQLRARSRERYGASIPMIIAHIAARGGASSTGWDAMSARAFSSSGAWICGSSELSVGGGV